jgi:hypothetical protein
VLGHDDALLLPLIFPGGAIGTIVYSQPSAITSTLRAPSPSNDAAAILVATRVAVAAARQRAHDAARALEQEQAVVDTIERQYAETYRHLAGKGVSDGSPMSARHNTDTFEPAPVPASTLRASLHAQAAALTSIRATVTDILAPDSTQYPRWRNQVLQTLRSYALADHVLPTDAAPTEDWLLMDEVVLSWIHGTLMDELQDIVRVLDDTAHRIWGALEAQFLGNHQTRIMYLEIVFHQLVQGDLSVDEYCRQMKTMADTLRTLGAPMTDESHVLNLLRGLSPRFDRVAPILTRMKPCPTFAEAKNDLLLEELRLSAVATAAPATALYRLQRTSGCPLRLRGGGGGGGRRPPPPPPRPPPPRAGGGGGGGGSCSPHSGPAALLSSATDCWLRGGSQPRSRPWSQGRTQWRWPVGRPWWLIGWLSVAILLQPVDWHHSHVAQAVCGCLGPSPHRLSAGLLCRCTPGGTLGSSPASARSSATPGVSGPAHVGALD